MTLKLPVNLKNCRILLLLLAFFCFVDETGAHEFEPQLINTELNGIPGYIDVILGNELFINFQLLQLVDVDGYPVDIKLLFIISQTGEIIEFPSQSKIVSLYVPIKQWKEKKIARVRIFIKAITNRHLTDKLYVAAFKINQSHIAVNILNENRLVK